MACAKLEAVDLPGESGNCALTGSQVEATRRPFEELYRANFPFVWRTLRRLGVQLSNLDDAAQDVFIVVHRRYADFRAGTSERAWLFAIVQRVASDQRRTRSRKGDTLPYFDRVASDAPGPHDSAENAQASDLLSKFLDQLDEGQRAAFILMDLEQMTGKEVAAALEVNVNTIAYRVGAARRQFAHFAEEHTLAAKERLP